MWATWRTRVWSLSSATNGRPAVKMHVKGNASFLKNTLTNLGNSAGYLELDNMQNTGTITRAVKR